MGEELEKVSRGSRYMEVARAWKDCDFGDCSGDIGRADRLPDAKSGKERHTVEAKHPTQRAVVKVVDLSAIYTKKPSEITADEDRSIVEYPSKDGERRVCLFELGRAFSNGCVLMS